LLVKLFGFVWLKIKKKIIIMQAERQVQFACEDSCGAIFVAEGR
jgi:hypothetical protein